MIIAVTMGLDKFEIEFLAVLEWLTAGWLGAVIIVADKDSVNLLVISELSRRMSLFLVYKA